MAVVRDRPYGNYNFLVDLGMGDSDAVQAGFSEAFIPEAYMDVIEYRNGNEKESGVRKIPGRAHYGNITLKRGVIGSLNLYQWWNEVRNGAAAGFRNVAVHLQNEDRSAIVLTWKLLRAWPVRYRFSSLEAKGKDVLIEILELACERIEIE
jgi:phage tail-like protein